MMNIFYERVPGLFVGLCNLDIVYYSDVAMPADNSKKKITEYITAIGGPAANAAVTYSLLGGEAYLVCAVGSSAMGQTVKQLLEEYGVKVIDIAEEQAHSGNISCIHVNTTNGDRTILSGQAVLRITKKHLTCLQELADKCHFALYDGNLSGVEEELVRQLIGYRKELVLDAGSYKDGFSICFAMKPTVISSEEFRDRSERDVFALNHIFEFSHSAQTRGANAIRYEKDGQILELPVRSATAVDTLGAGDIFHGAYCYFKYLKKMTFEEALACAAEFSSYTVEKRGVVAGIQYAKEMLV